jgi:hypothetical protein
MVEALGIIIYRRHKGRPRILILIKKIEGEDEK